MLTFCVAQSIAQGTTPAQDFDRIAAQAGTARESGKSAEALKYYEQAVKLRVNWEEGWWYMGTLQYDANRFGEAIPAFRNVLQIDSKMGPAWTFLGLCEFERRDYQNSLEHLEIGEKLGANDDLELSRVAKYHLAMLLNRAGEFDKATELLVKSSLDLASDQVKVGLGISLLRIPLLPDEIDPSYDALLQAAGEAAAAMKGKDPASSFSIFDGLIKKHEAVPFLHYSYGIALDSLGRVTDAIDQQRQEVKISPDSALAEVAISALELKLKHVDKALAAAEKALQLEPDSAVAHRARAAAESQLGKTQKAAMDLRKADELQSKTPSRDLHIAAIYSRNGLRPPPLLVTATTKSESATDTTEFLNLSRQAAALQSSGNFDQSIQTYAQALELRPDWYQGRWNLAMLCYESGRYSDAVGQLKIWTGNKPEDGTAWAVMGLSEFEMRDYDNALIHLQRGYDLGMGGSKESLQLAQLRLGTLLNRTAHYEHAMQVLAAAGDAPPLGPQIIFALGMSLLRISDQAQIDASEQELVKESGRIAFLLKDSQYDRALPLLRALLQQHPRIPFLHYAYGVALASLSQYDQAAAQFHEELKISPEEALPYIRLASLSLQRLRPEEALPSALKSVELRSSSGEAHYVLGRTYLELGQNDKAVQELETAEKISPGSAEVHFNLAKAYAKSSLADRARQEREIFSRLNEVAQNQVAHRGSQSYGSARETVDSFNADASVKVGTTSPR